MPRVTLMLPGSVRTEPGRVEAFRKRLRELGYVEGKTLILDIRELQGRFDQSPGIMGEVVRSNPNVIVTNGPLIRPAMKASSTIPIVTAISSDPVKSGLAASFARPGGNVTGNALIEELSFEKNVEISARDRAEREARRAAVRSDSLDLSIQQEAFRSRGDKEGHESGAPARLQPAGSPQSDCRSGCIKSRHVGRSVPGDLRRCRSEGDRGPVRAPHLPAIYSSDSFVGAGGLAFYGFNSAQFFANAAVFVDRILKGAKPGDLPFEQPTQFEMVINLKTASALGLKIPKSVLLRADRVIE